MLCFRCGTYAPDGSSKCPGCGQVFQKTNAGQDKRKASGTRQPQAIFSIGETVAERYRILDVIGSGGVGTVYRAHDTDIDVDVALKAVAPKLLQTADEQKTFSRFIKTARKLHHANIVRIYDEGRDAGAQGERRFFTMQLLEGLTLRKIIQLRREKTQVFQLAEIEPIFAQLAAAMDYAHKTVWHGDLKPENVLVLPDLLKVTDFCLIQALPTKPFLAIQKSRGAAYQYIAPEVRLEASRIDGRADVYSLGVILAEMLTGEVYEGHSAKNIQKALEALPRNIDATIRKAVHESPDTRFQTAGELSQALAEIVARGDAARVATPAPRSMPPPPPQDSDEHSVRSENSDENSLPAASESSVIMLEHQPAGTTDVTEVPELPSGSDETPVVGLRAKNVQKALLEPDTDEQRTGAANRNKADAHGIGADEIVEEADAEEEPDTPAQLGPPTHEDTEQDEGDKSEEVKVPTSGEVAVPTRPPPRSLPPPPPTERSNGHSRNGHEPAAAQDPYGPPPPLPEDPSDSGRLVSSPDNLAIHDEPTLNEKSAKVGLHDALTSLRPNPKYESTLPKGAFVPPQERPTTALPALSIPPPQVTREQPTQQRKGMPLLPIFAAIGVFVGAAGFFAVREYRNMAAQLDKAGRGTVNQPAPLPPPTEIPPKPETPPAPAPTGATGPTAAPAAPAPADDAKKKAEEEAARKKAADDEKARLAAEEDARRKAAAEEEATRRRAEEDARRAAEKHPAANDDAKRKKEEDAAARRAAAEDARRKKDEEKQAAAEARKAAAEETKRRKEEDAAARKAAADEKKRAAEEAAAARRAADEEKKKAAEEAAARKKADEEAAAAKKHVAAADPAQLSCPKGMALVVGGAFKMGSAANDPMHNFEEKRLELVEVKPFCIDYYEFPNSKSAKPTTNVSWFQAQELCKGKGKRLCEEEEWEKACKGPDNERYPYGNSWDPDRCSTQDAEGNDRELAEQKAFPKCRSGFGLINLSGNASEWVASSFSSTQKDRVHKGGSANRPDWATRCANRANLAPSGKNPFVGFRCCADPGAGTASE
ncbi:MAG: SUMF1/EgtB/PvdO family nonheme iron enzyme [Deltaproteobacteria bacterium]|nr:SUMF1/EgtB/PvdO family nonheme iron enzyme [Deltaproteobacteria bacterium]